MERVETTALVPIAEAMPELRAEQFAKVREWDAALLHLDEEYEAASGEYLIKIRDALKPRRGLWQGYLDARGIPYATANDRIRRAEGRPHLHAPKTWDSQVLPAPAPRITIHEDNWPPIEAEYSATEEAAPDELDWPAEEPQEEPPFIPALPSLDRESVREEVSAPALPTPERTAFSIAEWNALKAAEREGIIATGHDGRAGLNEQKSDSIEWALWSWNPVTGCLHNCPYCYARDIANRFYTQGFTPTFQPSRLGAPIHQRVPAQAETELGYRNIFTCSMADLFGKWVPAEWIEAVLDVARSCPQWNFLFLTKFPVRLAEFTFPDNAWIGTSVDCQARVANAERSFAKVKGGVKWLSVEPMLEPLRFNSLDMFDWVVVGGASASTETPAWIPPRRWVVDLESQAQDAGCMIYEKTNLGIQGPARLREYPGWERPQQALPGALAYLPSIEGNKE